MVIFSDVHGLSDHDGRSGHSRGLAQANFDQVAGYECRSTACRVLLDRSAFLPAISFLSVPAVDNSCAQVASFDAALRTVVEEDKEREDYRRRLDTFLIVQFLIGAEEEREGLTAKLLRSVALITLVILPILLLLQFQLTFVPYHEAWVTWIHRIAVVVDIRLAWVFWSAIARGDGKIYFPELQFVWRGFFKRETFFKNAKAMLAEIGLAIRSGFRRKRVGFIASFGTIFASFFVFAFADEPIANIFRMPVPTIDKGEIVWERNRSQT